jgi:hypothetical protein
MRVLVAGSSDLDAEFVPAVKELGERLMKETGYILVTGGLKSRGTERLAVDGLVAEAALAALGSDLEAQARIVTILPERDRDFPRIKIGRVVSVAHADARMRRNSMVLTSDAVVIVRGSEGSRQIADLAYIAGKPLITLAFTGGAASTCWELYQNEVKDQLRLSPDEVAAITRGPGTIAVSACLQILNRILRPQCFVAMPYSEHSVPNVFATIRTAVENCGYQVIRVDQERFAGSILERIWDQIRQADLFLADLTGNNPNVLYELGIAHAFNKPSLLITYSADGHVPEETPFDLRAHRILAYDGVGSLALQLKTHVPAVALAKSQKTAATAVS